MARTPNARMLAEADDLSRDLSAVTALGLDDSTHPTMTTTMTDDVARKDQR